MYKQRIYRPRRKSYEGGTTEYPKEIPKLRRKIIIIDYDFGEESRHEIELYKTSRIDCYKAIINGEVWKERVGWAKVLEGVRKSFTRILSQNSI